MTTSDWARALDGSNTPDKDELKRELDLQAVCERELGAVFDGLVADCPLHPDAGKRNFSVFGDGLTQAGCWVCAWRGDVFDVIMTARGCGFSEALRVARRYLDEGLTRDFESAPYARAGVRVPIEAWRTIIGAARSNAEADDVPIVRLLQAKGLRMPAGWLRAQFDVGVRGGTGTVVIPHYDRYGQPLGYKERRHDSVPVSAKGSRFTDLYGAWRDLDNRRVVLCEGESDTWTVAHLVFNRYDVDVFGLPTGAGTPPRDNHLELLDGRRVLLAFDADPAGREGVRRWGAVLPRAQVLDLPDGRDCSGLETRDLRERLRRTGWLDAG